MGSVALRYRHPCAVGVWPGGLSAATRLSGCRWCHEVPAMEGVPFRLEDRLARLEAVLFLSRQPQTSRKLAQLAGLADGTKARTLVRTLNRRYDAEGSAFRVEEVAGGFQLMTRSKFAPGCGGCTPRRRKSGCRPRPWKPWPSWPIGNRC